MPLNPELISLAQPKDGVFCVFGYGGSSEGKIIVTSLLPEDFQDQGGKDEADPRFDSALIPLEATMFSMLSGGVKPGENHYQALVREVAQEAGLVVNDQELTLMKLNQSTQTIQKRKDKGLFNIRGVGYQMTLFDQHIRQLETYRAVTSPLSRQVIVKTPNELYFSDEYKLRPFAQSVLRILLGISQSHQELAVLAAV